MFIIQFYFMLKKHLLLLLTFVFGFLCTKAQVSMPQLPSPEREFRAAWVASVANINWPSKPGLSTQQQQDEAIALLDLLKKNNFNRLFFRFGRKLMRYIKAI